MTYQNNKKSQWKNNQDEIIANDATCFVFTSEDSNENKILNGKQFQEKK